MVERGTFQQLLPDSGAWVVTKSAQRTKYLDGTKKSVWFLFSLCVSRLRKTMQERNCYCQLQEIHVIIATSRVGSQHAFLLQGRLACLENIATNFWRISSGNSPVSCHLPVVKTAVFLPQAWVTMIVQSVIINQRKPSKALWQFTSHYSPTIFLIYDISERTKIVTQVYLQSIFHSALYPRFFCIASLACLALSWNWFGQRSWHEVSSQVTGPQANQSPFNTVYNGGRRRESDFHWKVGGKIERGAFPSRMVLARLSPPALVTGLRVETIERCKLGFE